ncbi:phosphatidylglycerophosphatase A [Dissulfurirhabdus thermomarina]|uniref:Phosphatidylglycerophosphatase A n=1 Tax=Dissulfurirhabdus thermomarina TaxID=1765737 RepID=A0A6N9TNW8_DISTH|nr:phosphatidylglycerophosphatase A [Dissulfurirhabdus thermomarina]NDY41793.1 phosphatidylglycerophosphatase A [Dissulfurirhabdus thermomarina]NMX23965.1 phosphatidylglycerophosphatase A [Dissulfurirhabdus thermomarina]
MEAGPGTELRRALALAPAERLAVAVASGGLVGFAPYAPGTLGSGLGVALYAAVAGWAAGPFWFLVLGVAALGTWTAHVAGRALGVTDHPAIVVDEVTGMLVALAGAPATPVFLAAAFCLFRFFDIVKPPPVRWLERTVPGGAGVMLDDLAAGLLANGAWRLGLWAWGAWHAG